MAGNLVPHSQAISCKAVFATALFVGAVMTAFECLKEAFTPITLTRWQSNAMTIAFATGLAAFAACRVLRKACRDATAIREEQERREKAEQRSAQLNEQVTTVSRQVSMAQTASDALHNLKNVMNGVRITSQSLFQAIDSIHTDGLHHAVALLEAQKQEERSLSPEELEKLRTFLPQFSDFLEKRKERLASDTQQILKDVDLMTRTVRTQQGSMKLSGAPEWLSLTELVEDAVRLCNDGLREDGIELKYKFDFNGKIEVPEHMILQVLINLINNARFALRESFTKERLICITTRCHGKGGVAIEVSDNGIGIPKEHLPSLFTHGFTTRPGGHGFGLHSCQQIAGELSGEVTVHSDGPGKGAVFALQLPNVAAAVAKGS